MEEPTDAQMLALATHQGLHEMPSLIDEIRGDLLEIACANEDNCRRCRFVSIVARMATMLVDLEKTETGAIH